MQELSNMGTLTMPTFFRRKSSNRAVHWVFYYITYIRKEYNYIYILEWRYQILTHAHDSQGLHFELEYEPRHVNQYNTLQ